MLEVEKLFRRLLHCPPAHVLRVPGSVELLGGCAAFSKGLALGVALDKTVNVALSPRSDGRIFLAIHNPVGTHEFWLSDLSLGTSPPWTFGMKRVLAMLRKRGVHFSGFNAVFGSSLTSVPGNGVGMSMLIGLVLGVRLLHPFRLTDTGVMRPPQRDQRGRLPSLSAKEKLSMARLCRDAGEDLAPYEDLLHAVTPLFARPFHLVSLDFLHESVTVLSAPGTASVVLSPRYRTPHEGEAWILALQGHCESAAQLLGLRSLRQADQAYLRENHHRLGDAAYRVACHAIGETRRVMAAEVALGENDVSLLGRQLDESHESARDFVAGSPMESEVLIGTARAQRGFVGARLVGPAFGWWTVNLVLMTELEGFCGALERAHFDHTGRVAHPIISQIGGASW